MSFTSFTPTTWAQYPCPGIRPETIHSNSPNGKIATYNNPLQLPTTTGQSVTYALKQAWATPVGKAGTILYALSATSVLGLLAGNAITLGKKNGFKAFPWKKFFKGTAEFTIPFAGWLLLMGAGFHYGAKSGKEITQQLKEQNISNPTFEDVYQLPYFQQHKFMRRCLENDYKLYQFLLRHGLAPAQYPSPRPPEC